MMTRHQDASDFSKTDTLLAAAFVGGIILFAFAPFLLLVTLTDMPMVGCAAVTGGCWVFVGLLGSILSFGTD